MTAELQELVAAPWQPVILASEHPSRIHCAKCQDFLRKTVQTPVASSMFILRSDKAVSAGRYAADYETQ